MATIEAQKLQHEIPDSPRINRLVRHVNHMKKMLELSEEALVGHMRKMLVAAEEALQQEIKDFQEICEHDFKDVLGDNPHYDGPAIVGWKCRKCFLFRRA